MDLLQDPKLREVVNMLKAGFFMGDMHQFDDIYDSLVQDGDYFLVLKDFKKLHRRLHEVRETLCGQ